MKQKIKICDESESEYFAETSEMMQLCPDCSHNLYGYPNCIHEFLNGRCTKCYWNGKTSNYLYGLKTERWTPITFTELKELIDLGTSKMSVNQIKKWSEILIKPEKWQEDEYGEKGNGFWAVAIIKNKVIWYNDIEEGFNISTFSKLGKIDEYFAEQDELQSVINK